MSGVRFAGRIRGWVDDKGYGFVEPNGGGERAFVHVKAFPRGSARPCDGDLVSYATRRDAKGRINAVDVRFAGQNGAPAARRGMADGVRGVPALPIAGSVLAVVIVAAWAGSVPVWLPVAYLVASLVAYLAYAADKAAAGRGLRRIPESTLHLMALAGGWPGALVAQQQFRHKTVKLSFRRVFWLTVGVNTGAVGWWWVTGRFDTLIT